MINHPLLGYPHFRKPPYRLLLDAPSRDCHFGIEHVPLESPEEKHGKPMNKLVAKIPRPCLSRDWKIRIPWICTTWTPDHHEMAWRLCLCEAIRCYEAIEFYWSLGCCLAIALRFQGFFTPSGHAAEVSRAQSLDSDVFLAGWIPMFLKVAFSAADRRFENASLWFWTCFHNGIGVCPRML